MVKMITAIFSIVLISIIGLAVMWVYAIPIEWMWNKYLLQVTGVKVTTTLVFGSSLTLSMIYFSVFHKVDLKNNKEVSEAISEILVSIVIKIIALYVPWAILYVVT